MSDRPTPRTEPYKGIWATAWIGGKSIYEHACDIEREADKLREALQGLRDCITETRGPNARLALEAADKALNTEPKPK